MRTTIQINVPKPCHEDWAKMTPNEKGRHCLNCQKTVYDFTKQSDENIVKTILTDGNVCGRYRKSQLKRELVLSRKEKNNYLSYVASTLFAILSLGTQDIMAQKPMVTSKVDSILQSNINCGIVAHINEPRTLIGNVLSEIDKLPLPGANIIIKGTSNGVQTDFDGNFSINIRSGDTLVFSFIGMKTREFYVSNQTKVNISLQEDLEWPDCGNYIVMGVPSVNYKSRCEAEKIRKARKLRREKIRNEEIERTQFGKFLYSISNVFRRKK